MIFTPIKLLVWNVLSFVAAVPLRSNIDSINNNWTSNLESGAQYQDVFLPETDGISYHELFPYFSGPSKPLRSRRDVEMEDFGVDNVTFEIPTIMRVNDSHNGDIQVSLLTPVVGAPNVAALSPGCAAQCLPQRPPPQTNKQPISLTIAIDNIIPPGKADKYVITNSSEIRGCGAILKINFCETKTTTQCPSDLVFSFDLSSPSSKAERIESQNRKKTEEEEEDEETPDQKTLQEILRRILAGRLNSTTLPPDELPALLHNSTGEPLTLILNPSMLHKLTGKLDSTTPRGPTTFNHRSPNPPDYDYLCKVVEHLSSNIPKQKLASLLSSLVAKAYSARE